MNVVTSLKEVYEARRHLKDPVGLVPTMGFLHEGHLSLVRRARSECGSVAVSIFVNPTQFGPSEDLEDYPRDLERDSLMLEDEKIDLLWTPLAEELYPDGFQTWVAVENLSQPLEGAQRPGHFRGVATIVTKLLVAVRPDRVYVGQKDAQQAQVIRRLVGDLNFPVEVVICPIIREADGLAMSSRNAYLSQQERKAATILHRALTSATEAYAAGEHGADALRLKMYETLLSEPMAKTQYVSVADPETLEEQWGTVERGLLSLAVFVGKTRLIDNVVVGGP
jgi:pantoate--beta-alanine ligase